MQLHELLEHLRRIAPEPLAEDWDAVGLQVGHLQQPVERALLCIDLTDPVLREAAERGVSLIVAYHPVIFRPLAAITNRQPKQRIVLEAIRRGMAIYSPHTALDAASGGVNDYLAAALEATDWWPIRPAAVESLGGLHEELPAAAHGAGQGRVVQFDEPITLEAAANRLKARLGLGHLHVGPAEGADAQQLIDRLALCPGAGGSLLAEAGPIQAFFTGEMRHHDQLAARAGGSSVLLAGHTETERPFLSAYRDMLVETGADVEWIISESDRPPTSLW
jgi:dinuclear metal center YbgI/SA1388 family protein